MGGITLVGAPAEPECHTTKIKSRQAEALNQLALDASALTGQNLTQFQSQIQGNGSFSISDFLVPGLQSKAWEDWQVADELNPFAMDSQSISSDLAALPFQFELDGMLSGSMWDTTTGLSSDQAYDEYVFDLASSNFEVPATVNIADLIVGPNSMAPSVSPLDLALTSMPSNYNNYQDLALANLYGFTEQEMAVSESDLGSDLSEVESSSDDDEDDEEDEEDDDELVPIDHDASNTTISLVEDDDDMQLSAAVTISLATTESPKLSATVENSPTVAQQWPATADPNKRRMEEALVARINNDLGPEHMAGLFKILKSFSGQVDAEDEDDDEEMEVDLSRLDETTLVELYQYVEACCMQTLGSILAAEEQERKRAAAAAAKAEQEALERARYYEQRTPELSPSHSSSSYSPSPPYPSSGNSGCGSSNNKKRSTTDSTSCSNYYERSNAEEQTEALWMTVQHKSKRKRVNNNSPICVGGGGTGKGRRKQKSFEEVQGSVQDEDMEFDEDDEIDVVGI